MQAALESPPTSAPADRLDTTAPELNAVAAGWLAHLNPSQREAATWGRTDESGRFVAPPLLVIAGAGTGKTATLAHRVAHLIIAGVDPARILLLTFSRRAAREMISRAERLVAQALGERGADLALPAAHRPVPVRLPWAGTFHAIGARLLREYAASLGLAANFGILDRGDAADLIDVTRYELGYSSLPKRFPRKDTCLAIYSHRVNTGWSLERVLEETFPWCAEWADQLRALFRVYVERKQQNGVLDYDDLLLWWDVAMLEPAIAADAGGRFEHVLVDEYQDTNALQARILRAFKPDGRGLTVVGDDAQSIYAFRAADVRNILEFPGQFTPAAHRVTLETNYRSVQPVLDLANALIAEGARQYPKTLRAERAGSSARPRLVTVLDDRAQAEHVVAEILRQREDGVPLRRQAVLFRSSHHSDLLELELMRRNIPFVKYGGLKFLEAAHVKDLLSVLRWAENPHNTIAGFRVLQLMRGIGPASARRCLVHLAGDQAPRTGDDGGDSQGAANDTHGSIDAKRTRVEFSRLAEFVAPPSAAEDWAGFATLMHRLIAPDALWSGQIEQVRKWYQPLLDARFDDAAVRSADLDMLTAVAEQFETREHFLTELTLDPAQASGDLAGAPLLDEDYLVLSTVHSAKGQEWDAVYVLNVADGNFPNEFSTGKPDGIEEERRLLYVAITRARDTLHLIEPQRYYVTQQPRLGAGYVHGARSRFLTPGVRACFARPERPPIDIPGRRMRPDPLPKIDAAARMRDMWS